MLCDDATRLLDAHVDGELARAEGQAVAGHVASCPHCAERLRRIDRVRAAVRGAGRFAAPAGLECRIRAAIAAKGASGLRWHVPAAFGLGLAAGALALLLVLELPARSPSAPGLAEFVSAHVRAQVAERDTAIASGDPHTVRPWLGGRIGLAPRVVDLSDEGFPLLGARIDHVGGREAVALVYGRRKHRINLFVQADTGKALPEGQQHGFAVRSWRDLDLAFVAVSDIAGTELDDFVRLVRARSTAGRVQPPKTP